MIGKIQARFSNDWKKPGSFFPMIGKPAVRGFFRLAAPALMFLIAFTPGINFMEDLGRHLLLGRVILETGRVPDTNLLTYTWPGHPFVNHHWLSEVVLYLLHGAAGLNGLIVLKALLMAGVLGLALRTVSPGRLSARYGLAAVLAAVVLGFRAHIRPELFTFLGVALYGWGFERLRRRCPGRARLPTALLLLAYGGFWANAHIYFVFGLGMAGAFFLERWAARRAWPWPEAAGLAALVGISLWNPNGWRGLLYPFGIFAHYGVSITENASPLELWQTVLNPMLIALPILSVLALAALAAVIRRTGRDGPEPWRAANYLILLAAALAAWRMARSAPLLALAALPVVGEWARRRAAPAPWRAAGVALTAALGLWLAVGVIGGGYARRFPSPIAPTPFGLDTEERYMALRKLREDGLPGRVFSDYNIGSLVEYNIYPEPGYVDNRPEAFPVSFWNDEYLPVLSLGEEWERVRRERGIQTVAVSLPGVSDGYVRAMMSRPEWRLVHLDFLFAVWVLATEDNEPFMNRHLFTLRRLEDYAARIASAVRALPARPAWRRQVEAEQIVYELYSLACVNEFQRLWPMLWALHRQYPDYQLLHELLRISAPPESSEAVRQVMARRARWPLAAKQVLDWGAVLESDGRLEDARAVYRRGRWFFPLNPELRQRARRD